jgi:steroid delta-isomerase-like uncharacterized protein
MAKSENVAAIERAVEQMNSGNVEGYLELYSDNLTLHGYPPGVEGKEGATAFYTAFRKGIDPFHLTIEALIEEGDTVAGRYSIRGKHADELMGVPATGNDIEISGQSFFRFEDGRVVERWQALDAVPLLTQLGALPAPA